MKKQHVRLSDVDREYLETLIRRGELPAKVYRRALGLLELDRGQTHSAVSKTLKVTGVPLSTWCAKYAEIGLLVLYDQPRSGRPVEIDGNQRAKITALACSEPPQGYTRWSLRLLADKVVELEYCDHISLTEVGGGIRQADNYNGRQTFAGIHFYFNDYAIESDDGARNYPR